jgi:hypothetical protein
MYRRQKNRGNTGKDPSACIPNHLHLPCLTTCDNTLQNNIEYLN